MAGWKDRWVRMKQEGRGRKGKKEDEKDRGGEKFGSTGHRNISLSIRRRTRWMSCLTADARASIQLHNMLFCCMNVCVKICMLALCSETGSLHLVQEFLHKRGQEQAAQTAQHGADSVDHTEHFSLFQLHQSLVSLRDGNESLLAPCCIQRYFFFSMLSNRASFKVHSKPPENRKKASLLG